MRASSKQVRYVPKATSLKIALFVAVFALIAFPMNAHAEPVTDPGNETGVVVQSPGAPTATSSSADHTIVWVWTPPAGGLAPDATNEPSQTSAVDRPTDIIKFGYELSLKGVVLTSELVDSTILTVKTPVVEDGIYTLKVWSADRVANVSPPVLGTMTIVTPVVELRTLPPIKEGSIPGPVNTTPLSSTGLAAPTPTVVPLDTSDASPDASVLSADDAADTPGQATGLAVAETSSGGWVVLGVPWYVLLVILAGLFAGGRQVLLRAHNHR